MFLIWPDQCCQFSILQQRFFFLKVLSAIIKWSPPKPHISAQYLVRWGLWFLITCIFDLWGCNAQEWAEGGNMAIETVITKQTTNVVKSIPTKKLLTQRTKTLSFWVLRLLRGSSGGLEPSCCSSPEEVIRQNWDLAPISFRFSTTRSVSGITSSTNCCCWTSSMSKLDPSSVTL